MYFNEPYNVPLIFSCVCGEKFVREQTLVFFCEVKFLLLTIDSDFSIFVSKRSDLLKKGLLKILISWVRRSFFMCASYACQQKSQMPLSKEPHLAREP